jgi:hypothetical protein
MTIRAQINPQLQPAPPRRRTPSPTPIPAPAAPQDMFTVSAAGMSMQWGGDMATKVGTTAAVLAGAYVVYEVSKAGHRFYSR